MAFVKLDTRILDSTLWIERECREVFITALLMAEPFELKESREALEVRTLEKTGFTVPPGWYGFVESSGIGIVRRALVDVEPGMIALERLGSPDLESRSADFEGRRLIRIDGGFIVLNYMKYRDRDHTAAERQKRLRDRKKQDTSNAVTSQRHGVTSRIADADADAETYSSNPLGSTDPGSPYSAEFEVSWKAYPKRSGNNPKSDAYRCWCARLKEGGTVEAMAAGTLRYRTWCEATGKLGTETVMQAQRFYGRSKPFEQDFDVPAGAKPATPVPNPFIVFDDMATWAHERGMGDPLINAETEKFGEHYKANGMLKADWDAAWREWMLRAATPAPGKMNGHAPGQWWASVDGINAKGRQLGVERIKFEPDDKYLRRVRKALEDRKQ